MVPPEASLAESIVKRVLLFVILAVVAGPLLAETVYVSDDLSITMRTGQGNRYSIIQMLSSGTPVRVIKQNNGYSEIQAPDGKQGWVLTRFLQPMPVARDRLATVQKQLSTLQQKNTKLQTQLKSALSAKSGQSSTIQSLKQDNATLKQRLAHITNTAAHSLQISRQNAQLKTTVAHLEQVRSQLQYENRITESRREGIVIGAVILIAGVLVGLILPRLRLRRRSAWDSY